VVFSLTNTLSVRKVESKFSMYAPCHKSCPLLAFETVEKSDTFCGREHTGTVSVLVSTISFLCRKSTVDGP
jgi:hypothetical protein